MPGPQNGMALEYSTAYEALENMEIRLADGVDIDSVDKHGMTALHYNYKHETVVHWLLDHKANIDSKGAGGNTALHLLCKEYKENMADLTTLLSMHADPNARNDEGACSWLRIIHFWRA